jgi:hypothetical protein
MFLLLLSRTRTHSFIARCWRLYELLRRASKAISRPTRSSRIAYLVSSSLLCKLDMEWHCKWMVHGADGLRGKGCTHMRPKLCTPARSRAARFPRVTGVMARCDQARRYLGDLTGHLRVEPASWANMRYCARERPGCRNVVPNARQARTAKGGYYHAHWPACQNDGPPVCAQAT